MDIGAAVAVPVVTEAVLPAPAPAPPLDGVEKSKVRKILSKKFGVLGFVATDGVDCAALDATTPPEGCEGALLIKGDNTFCRLPIDAVTTPPVTVWPTFAAVFIGKVTASRKLVNHDILNFLQFVSAGAFNGKIIMPACKPESVLHFSLQSVPMYCAG
jgi:hypothetical protein